MRLSVSSLKLRYVHSGIGKGGLDGLEGRGNRGIEFTTSVKKEGNKKNTALCKIKKRLTMPHCIIAS